MRTLVLLAFAACSHATSPAPASADELSGTWHGTSTCLVTPSACHDEEVVYHAAAAPGGWSINAGKIIAGQEQPMGDLTCTSTGPGAIRCPVPGKGAFLFRIAGDRMDGQLVLDDGTKFRTVSVQRVR